MFRDFVTVGGFLKWFEGKAGIGSFSSIDFQSAYFPNLVDINVTLPRYRHTVFELPYVRVNAAY